MPGTAERALHTANVVVIAIGGLVLLSLQVVVWAYDVKVDDYGSTELPGRLSDDRELPNVPFTTDSNRFSDGTSSISPYSITSPHFPEYDGPVFESEVLARQSLFFELADNAAAQGLATSGAGAREKEQARKDLLDIGVENNTLPNVTFKVDANSRWNPSKFPIQAGERYRIEVFGTQFWRDGRVLVDSQGYRSDFDALSNCYVALGRCRSYLKEKRRLGTANWFALVCGIGDFTWKLSSSIEEVARYMPIREEQLIETFFPVGNNVTFESLYSGELICFANDADVLYHNNEGAINVTVTRLSWPPSRSFIYKEFLE